MLYAQAPHAQQKAMCVVGYLNISPAPSSPVDLSHDLVHEVLSETGYFEGQNMASEYRWAGSIMIGYRHWLPISSAERST